MQLIPKPPSAPIPRGFQEPVGVPSLRGGRETGGGPLKNKNKKLKNFEVFIDMIGQDSCFEETSVEPAEF